MYYIISSISLGELKKYSLPLDGCSKYDLDTYFETVKGKQFLTLAPLKIFCESSKSEALYNIAMFIFGNTLCYNDPIYLSILSNNQYYKEFNFPFIESVNIGKYALLKPLNYNTEEERLNIAKHNARYIIKKEDRLFDGDFDVIWRYLKPLLKSVNLKETSIWEFKITDS